MDTEDMLKPGPEGTVPGLWMVRALDDFEFWILGVWGTEKHSKLRPAPWQGLRKRREIQHRVTRGKPPLFMGWHSGHFSSSLSF